MKQVMVWGIIMMALFGGDVIATQENTLFQYKNSGADSLGQFPDAQMEPTIIKINHVSTDQAEKVIVGMYPDVSVVSDAESRQITVLAAKSTLSQIQDLLRQLDRPKHQLKVAVTILELSYFSFDQYNNIFSDLTSGFRINYDFSTGSIKSSNLEGVLSHLTKDGHAKVLAQPTILTLDNQISTIQVGDQIPYISESVQRDKTISEVRYLNSGIELNILPKMVSKDSVIVEVDAKISSVKLWKEFRGIQYPILSNRHTTTVVTLENQKTLIIAGLLDSASKTNKSGVPVLSKIPILGWLFSNGDSEDVSSDVVFLITPYLGEIKPLSSPSKPAIATKN